MYVVGAQRSEEHVVERAHLAVHDDRIQSLFAAEMLVDDRLAHFGGRGDLLDADRLEALGGEERAPDADELFAPLV